MILRALITATLAMIIALPASASNTSRLNALVKRSDVVGLEAVGRLDSPNGFCSGTLIAADLVLTAAHCVYDRAGKPVDARTLRFRAGLRDGEVIAEANKKVTPRAVKKLIEEGNVSEVLLPFDGIIGRFAAKDIINEENGAIYVEAGDELTWVIDKDGEVTGGSLKEQTRRSSPCHKASRSLPTRVF